MVLDVSAHMPGFRLMLENEEGQYGNTAHTLKFEGSMFIYDPQRDISQWVPVRGVSASLTMAELRSANDLNNMNPYPYDGMGLVQLHSPTLVQGIPAGEESDSDSFDDSGEEWDKSECGDWLHCPSPPQREGPNWVEATAEVWRKVILEKDAPTWDDIISSSPQKNTEKEDSDWDKDTCIPTESQFEDAAMAMETCMDTVEESTAEVLPPENIVEALVGPGSQDMVQIHVGNDDLD